MKKKLYRVKENQMLAGVCTGMAKYFDIDVTLVRLLWVFISILTSVGIGGLIVYIVCAIIIPVEPQEPSNFQGDGTYYQPPFQG